MTVSDQYECTFMHQFGNFYIKMPLNNRLDNIIAVCFHFDQIITLLKTGTSERQSYKVNNIQVSFTDWCWYETNQLLELILYRNVKIECVTRITT